MPRGKTYRLATAKAANAAFTSATIYPSRQNHNCVIHLNASQNPASANQGVSIAIDARPNDDAAWAQIATYANTGWSEVTVWTQAAALVANTQMRARIRVVTGSTNVLDIWIVE